MGGPGSGRRMHGRKRPSTADALALDVRLLARSGRLAPSSHRFTWPSVWGDTTILIRVFADDRLELTYWAQAEWWTEGRVAREEVELERTPCRFGGSRPWFRCPRCGGRVAVLFWYGERFACRGCHGLAYASTRQDARRRLLEQADRLRRGLGGDEGLGTVPPKPAWLGWRVYWRAVERIGALDAAYAAAVMPGLERAGAFELFCPGRDKRRAPGGPAADRERGARSPRSAGNPERAPAGPGRGRRRPTEAAGRGRRAGP